MMNKIAPEQLLQQKLFMINVSVFVYYCVCKCLHVPGRRSLNYSKLAQKIK